MSDEHSLPGRLAADLDGHFEELVRTFQDRLYGFTLRLTSSPQDAEESAQDTFVRAYRALQRYPKERIATIKLKAWLYQIALNVVRNRVRRGRLTQVTLDAPVSDSLASDAREDHPDQVVIGVEGQARMANALQKLPERYATAVVLRHVQGLSYEEAGQVLGQPVGTTKSDVHRGLRLLRAALEPELELDPVGEPIA
ncbi:MAG: sigma-70 family RNA polymerase sigma factor [Chloroflexi bacterium]|nr:sigma-70 family RNA polymerase sigma factor [Chloroflexota bacterium]MBV9895210.1 sigma-70 family RNA polymerase sigma factor [Chloroflexota bacterium]